MARKQKMKVYHGIPKSITDEHTIFYAENVKSNKITPMPTGYGGILEGLTPQHLLVNNLECLSVDFWIYERKQSTSAGAWCSLLEAYSNNTRQVTITHDQYHLFVSYPNFNWSNSFRFPLGKNIHVRVVIKNNCIFVYLNGNLHYTNISTGYNLLAVTKLVFFEGGHTNSSEIYISDFHVSNIDRGDYFPNLPQDFIDGKAVIKPRMGQQQIKGDPMYSQVTELKVPNQPYDVLGTIYSDTPDSEGLNVCFNSPELSTASAYEWEPRFGKIRIKGLNGEVISGVIDTDTALCRVLRAIETNHLVVDSIDKLSVGDQLRAIRATDMVPNPSSVYYQITEIHPETSSIVVIRADGGDGWRQSDIDKGYTLAIEITASSSSPTVKTKEGTNVVGTWSGLGTTEATFTLGDNSNIVGKDLYVTYALTMPKGNSDFPELPHTIERAFGDNDIEMKPVDEIMIVDDFKGKISGSNKECPHLVKSIASATLQLPSGFTYEHSTKGYKSIINLSDSDTLVKSANINTEIPQQLFSFNIQEIIERKLGCEIPARDKVQWLKENLDSSASIVHYGYGVHPTGNLLKINWFNPAMNEWTLNGGSHASGSISKLENGTSMLADRIDSNGFVHILVYTNASNATKSSTIHTDYVCLKIKLKVNSTYTTLYCENTRAREDVCNPVLVQKETKTVKRYLPSKEIFSTECLYAKFKNEGVVSGLDILANKHVNIGVTTSEYNKFVSGSKINLNQLPLEKSEHLYTPILDSKIMDSIPNHVGANITELPVIHWWSDNGNKLFTVATTETLNFKTCVNGTNALKGQIGGYKDVNNNIIIYGDVDKSNILTKDGLRLYDISLVNKDGELMLYVIKSSEGNRFYFYNDAITLIKVPNRPLIK